MRARQRDRNARAQGRLQTVVSSYRFALPGETDAAKNRLNGMVVLSAQSRPY